MSVRFVFYMLEFLILSLATWRLSSLLVEPEDDGPWELFGKFRQLMGVKHDENTGLFYGKNFIAQALLCVWCISIWVGLGLGITYLMWGDPAVYFAFPFALSGAAIIVERIVNG